MRARSCGSGSRRSAHGLIALQLPAVNPDAKTQPTVLKILFPIDRVRNLTATLVLWILRVEAMESEYQTVGQMYERLRLMIRQRNDTGFRLAMTDAVLEPRNPFEPASKRRPKSVVAITLILVLVLSLIFLYFSLHHAR